MFIVGLAVFVIGFVFMRADYTVLLSRRANVILAFAALAVAACGFVIALISAVNFIDTYS